MMKLLVISLIFGLAGSLAGLDVNWDFQNYHLYLPYALLHGRFDSDFLASQIQTYTNPFFHVPIYLAVTYLPPRMVMFLGGVLEGFNFWLLFLISYFVVPKSFPQQDLIRLALATFGILSPLFMSELATTFNDNKLSILILLALYYCLTILDKPRQDSQVGQGIFLAGFLSGVATGFKLTNGVYSLTILILLPLFLAIRNNIDFQNLKIRKILSVIFWLLVSNVIGILISTGYWMAVLYSKFGNPLYPYYNEIFKSPYFAIFNFKDYRWVPKTFWHGLSYPISWASGKTPSPSLELVYRDPRWVIAIGLLGIYLLSILVFLIHLKFFDHAQNQKDRFSQLSLSLVNNFVISFEVVSFLVWLYMFGYTRYFIPTDLLSGIFIFCLVFETRKVLSGLDFGGISAKNGRVLDRFTLVVVLASFVFSLATTQYFSWGRLPVSRQAASWFDVQVPSLPSLAESIVLVVSENPLAYLIPSFPASTQFVRVEGNFSGSLEDYPGLIKGTLMEEQMKRKLAQHQGPFYILFPEAYDLETSPPINALNIQVDITACADVTSRLEVVKLCPVTLHDLEGWKKHSTEKKSKLASGDGSSPGNTFAAIAQSLT